MKNFRSRSRVSESKKLTPQLPSAVWRIDITATTTSDALYRIVTLIFLYSKCHYEHLLFSFIRMPHGNRMVSLWLEEMDMAMESINSVSQWVCMLMMIKLSMSLISRITVLWNGNQLRLVAKWLPVEMEKEMGPISCLTQEM